MSGEFDTIIARNDDSGDYLLFPLITWEYGLCASWYAGLSYCYPADLQHCIATSTPVGAYRTAELISQFQAAQV